jgi:putative addiction module component (TIGR02574 family)
MTERSEDWNVGLTQDLQDDEFVREFVAAAIEEGVPLKAVLLKLSAANRAELAIALWESLSDQQRDAATELSYEQKAELDRRWAEHIADPKSAIPWNEVRRKLRDDC